MSYRIPSADRGTIGIGAEIDRLYKLWRESGLPQGEIERYAELIISQLPEDLKGPVVFGVMSRMLEGSPLARSRPE
jgi:hypothetical protein